MSDERERNGEAPEAPGEGAEPTPDRSAETADSAGTETAASGETAAAAEGEGAAEPPAEDSLAEEPDAAALAAEEAAEKARKIAEAKAKAAAAAKAKAEREAAEAAKPPWEQVPQAPEWEEVEDDALVDALVEQFGERIERARRFAGDLAIDVAREAIADVAASLKEDHDYKLLVDLCGVDYPDREQRFEVIYQLYSFSHNRRLRLRVSTDEATPVPSLAGLYRSANWPEREVYDMYGVRFEGHPDMTRILLWEGFNGYPLRKDFPVEGVDTGSAIYPEYYEEEAGPVAGTGTGWKPAPPPAEPDSEAETPTES